MPLFIRRPVQLAALALLATGAVACSAGEEKRQLYLQSRSIAPLQVPAPLSEPVGDEVLALPQLGPAEGRLKGIDPKPPVDLPDQPESSQAPE